MQVMQPLPGHGLDVECVRFGNTTRGLLVSLAYDRVLRIWELEEGVHATLRHTISNLGTNKWLRTFELSPDDRYIAFMGDCMTSAPDKSVHVWDLAKRLQVRKMSGHGDLVCRVAWTLDSEKIMVASHEGYSDVWEVDVKVRVCFVYVYVCMYHGRLTLSLSFLRAMRGIQMYGKLM
jgi:WD40 repeat protein